jgi:hypothetical protein
MALSRVTFLLAVSLVVACAVDAPVEVPDARGSLSPEVADARIDEAVARCRFLPIRSVDLLGPVEDQRARLGTETREDLALLLSISQRQLAGLAWSRDGRRASAAAFIAWQRGDSALLLRIARDNLGSRAVAIPSAITPAQGGLVPVEESLVAYLSRLMSSWFGAGYPGLDVFDELYPGYPEFPRSAEWVGPWACRLERALDSFNNAALARIVKQVERLSEAHRLSIAAILYDELGERAQPLCMKLLSAMQPESMAALESPGFLSGDPLFHEDVEGSERAFVRAAAAKLMSLVARN